ncbi:MAG: hypothetical protein K8I82_09180, partial [Anaerolineae bacterium]|nr:hypothetical protein [Anaerolineae bacterium]
MKHHPRWLKPIALGVGILIAAILIAGILLVPYTSIQPPEGYEQSRLHWNTKNSTRFWGDNLETVAQHVSRAIYPATQTANRPDVILLYDPENWQTGLQAASLIRPLNALLLPATPNVTAEIERLQPTGSDVLDGAQVILLGDLPAPDTDFETTELDLTQVNDLLEEAGHTPRHVLLVDPENSESALLAAPWAAYSGDLIVFSAVDAPDDLPLYGLGAVEAETLISESDPAYLAVTFATYEDDENPLFGWGMNDESLTGYRSYTLANPEDPAIALLSANLARRGKISPLLWTRERQIPPVVNAYLFSQRAAFWNTPSEGPFHHFWILGNLDQISFPAQSQADYAVEIGPYQMKSYGMGGADMVGAVWVAFGLASAGWIAVHSAKFLPFQNWLMRLAWFLFALMMGPFGIPIYYLAHNRPVIQHGRMVMIDRPLWLQGIVATVSAVGFGAAIMIATGYLTTFFGLPLIPNNTPM